MSVVPFSKELPERWWTSCDNWSLSIHDRMYRIRTGQRWLLPHPIDFDLLWIAFWNIPYDFWIIAKEIQRNTISLYHLVKVISQTNETFSYGDTRTSTIGKSKWCRSHSLFPKSRISCILNPNPMFHMNSRTLVSLTIPNKWQGAFPKLLQNIV